jgi:cytochrome c oxidase assembly factor CtaG
VCGGLWLIGERLRGAQPCALISARKIIGQVALAVAADRDQQAGGLIMWIPGALVFLLMLTVVWFRWLGEEEYEPSQDARPVMR